MVLLTMRTHGPMSRTKCYKRAHSIKVAVNFRACERSELLKWTGWRLGWHYVI